MTSCFNLITNYRDISYNKYIFNNNVTNISYGLYNNSNNNYLIRGVPSNYPLTFFSQQSNTVSNIINFEALNSEPIIIYVSRGQDVSLNNGDFFRFYDNSYQLLNINHRYRTIYDSSLTDVRSNFYFMNNRSYTFKTTRDFCSNFPFTISGNLLTTNNSLISPDSSFTITIPPNADNNSNKLFYIDNDNDNDISGNLYILRDVSALKYYYGDISFSITNYNDASNIKLSLKSYDFSYGTSAGKFGNKEISNNDLFYYSSSCSYIINNNLPNNNEFLNKVSALDISSIGGVHKLSFNKGRHSTYTNNNTNNNPNTIYDLSFGLGKGSYIIIDVSSTFPIRLNNQDISNLIAIDTTYQPARIKDISYNNKTYYYGSFKINVFDDFSDVTIGLLNRKSLEELSYNSKFFYTQLPHLQGGSYGPIGTSYLKLKNQQSNYYDLSDSTLPYNKYDLNLDTSYKELSYIAADKYGHNLNILDFITSIPSSEQTINQEISNNIMSGLFNYNILYKVIDYENNSIQNIRTVVINSGPIIEISSNYFQNNNQYNNILNFQNNTFNSNYNFFDNIKVYIYDTSRQRINIPFEVSISGYYINNNNSRSKGRLINDTSFSYTQNYGVGSIPYLADNSGKNYYAYYRNFVLFRNLGTDFITINNIDYYDISETSTSGSNILKPTNSTTIDISTNTNIITIGGNNNSVKLKSIEQKFDISTISLNFNSTYKRHPDPISYTLNCSLTLNNYFFEISFNSPSFQNEDNCKITGYFKPINFFGNTTNNLIDVSYIGSYNLNISTKGLSNGDYFYDTSLIRNRFFNQDISNKSRTYTINIQDTISPVLTFYDKNTFSNSTTYLYTFPTTRTFNILQDICFVDLRNVNYNSYINSYVSNKPLIQYSDNSIYDFSYSRDISFTLIRGTNINYNDVTKEISSNSLVSDTSCVINYRAQDICANWSQDISLILHFIDVPYAELSGNAILTHYFSSNATYIDAGLLIYGINDSSAFIPNEISGNSIYELSRNIVVDDLTYDICYNTDLCLNNVSTNDYSFNYIITISGSTRSLKLSRKIRVIDNNPPYFLFQDFSSINYTLNDERLGNNNTTYNTNYTSSTRNIYSNDTSFNIDFSLVVYRTFDDLSKVLYDFDVSDNYQQSANITKTLTFGNNSSPFTFNDISNYFDNSIPRRLNKVTKSKGQLALGQLKFKYTIDDSYNTYSVTRNVDIINDKPPIIDFSFANYYSNTHSYQYVYFDTTFKDFSYVALDYNKPNSGYNFNQELSSILYNFDLSVNVNTKTDISYQITISSNNLNSSQQITNINNLSNSIKNLFSIKDTSFSLIYDISDNQDNSFQIIRNVKIIDISTNLDISFLNASSLLTVSFGDTNFDILRDVSFNHKRLTISSISFDISYNFANPNITSVSGSSLSLFDPSALIYRLGSNSVNYFPKAYSMSFYSKPRTITISNEGPLISFPSTGISHEIYTPLSDASLIFDVTSKSIYDEFFFTNYKQGLSYNGTNFKVTFDNCLNIMEPSAGLYNVYYSSTDLCGITTRRSRLLDVADRRPPVITICGDIYYKLVGDTYYIPTNSYYKEYGAYAYDAGTRTTFLNSDISIITQRVNKATSTRENITSETLENTKLLYNDPSYSYSISYSASDRFNKSQTITRSIIVTASKKPKLYPYIELSTSNGSVEEYILTSNVSINTRLINSTGIGAQFYDVSLSFNYDNSTENNQNIICQAVQKNIFARDKKLNNNNIKFKLRATNANDVSLATSFVNVEYETIDSTIIAKTYKIYFYARDIREEPIDQISFLEYNLNFVDTIPPQVIFLNNRNFETNSNLKYPLLSAMSINDLSININSYANFNNLYNNYEYYYKKSLANNIVLFDPGIKISDIVSGEVNYIDNSFVRVNGQTYNFISSDISINYYNVSNNTFIDICNILFQGHINDISQSYNVRDGQGNYSNTKSRTISVTRFPPFINLNYQKDCCSNNYITYYHKKFEKYLELKGKVVDYFDGFTLSFENVIINNKLNESVNGTYSIIYDVSNSANIYNNNIERKVDVITTLPLIQHINYHFNDILNFNYPTLTNIINKTYAKYSLYNGTYKFNVPHYLGFNIITREFDICNGIYAISNVVSITSDSSYIKTNINNVDNKFYFNNVTLTISGDFNRLSVELSNNAIYTNIFVYDSKNTYIDLYEVIDNNENNVIIDSSYIVDISNLNNPNSSPYFAFASTTARDLHLSIGNYRFYQYGYTNFHNPIKFSITKDGTHNGGIEYTKNIFRKNLPGVSILNRNPNSSYTQINIDATTPATLYYYCENFPNMGGRIQIKNNIIFSKQTIILNNYVIDASNQSKILNSAYYAAHNISDEDVLKNRVLLTQRFRVSGGDLSFVNITCITQQNIQHNMLYNLKQEPHKLIIRKHIDLDYRPDISFTDSPYSVMKNNTNKYLVENKKSSYNFSNTYINLFKYDFNSALEVEKRDSDPQLDIYDEDIRPIFYNYKNYNFFQVGSNQLLDEINNYIDFFRTNKLLTKTLLAESFKYKLSDFFFAKSSKVLNLDNDNEYNYNEQLLAPRIRITNITGNYVTFTLDIYYNSNNKEVLFGTYEYIVYSTSFINISNVINSPAIRDFITFYNGSLTITSNLIYSYNVELSNNFYNSRIYDNLSNSDLSNTVFLSIKDTSNNNASLCGLTKQNLYNNIYFDENQTLIFHKFGATTIVNYQVNTPALTLEHTLSESTNNDNYLIDICANDIYNFYNERPLNFNTLRDLSSNEEYNVYIAFAINDELASTNNYLTQFDIQPIYFNNIPVRRIGNIYRQYSQNLLNSYNDSINIINEISYNSISNKLTSHSYVIDLNDYFDIKLFKNNLLATNSFSTDFVDITKLSYSLLDICFTIPFNLYDINASQSVIFNPINLNLLLTMRNRVIPLYYKLTYMIKVLVISFPNVPNNRVTLTFNESDNINYYINLLTPDPLNLIADFYTNKVSIATLNNLFMEIFDNIQTLLYNFDTVINSYNIRHIYLVNISNFLNMVIDFNYINIDYLDNIITLLESNVENILTNMLIYLGENNITMILKLYNLTSNIVLANGNVLTNNDISYLDYCFKAFYTLNNELDLMRKEIAVRNYDYENIFESYKYEIASNSTNFMEKRYKNLYRGVNLDAVKLYSDLSYNFKLLNTNFILDYSYVLYNYANVNYYTSPFPKGTNNIVDYQPYNDASINNYETLYTNVNNLYNIITSVFNIVSSDYNIINKPTLYVNTRYDFVGSKLLINSYYSNSIALKLNIKYKKSLYQTIDLSNIYLDITIPDLIPPTLIFNNNADISFNENILNSDASINALVSTKLINDLSYIDLNQSYTITSASRKYYDASVAANIVRPLNSSSNYSLSLLQIDFTDISNVIFNDVSAIYTYIKYVLLDNANNRNIINRKILLINDNTEPIFFYKAINTTWRAYGSSSTTSRPPLIVSQSITQEAFFTTLNEAIIIVDPLLYERYPDLFKLEYSDISLTILRKDASNIDLSYIKIVSEISNISVPIQTINNVQSITNFSNLMNNQLVIESSANNLYVEYFSSTNVYPRPGQLRIKLQIIPSIVIAETSITTHCCYPKVEYKPIQDNYKLGSQNTAVMRMAKYIINRHI